MMYEDSAVLPTEKFELFRTALLKYFPGCYHCYIVIVQGKVTETIILTHIYHFTMSSFQDLKIQHCTIKPLHHCIIQTTQLFLQHFFTYNITYLM